MFRTAGAFTAGVVVGWVGRGMVSSNRELLLRTIGVATLAKRRVTRVAAEQVEWWQDLVAEAMARIDHENAVPHDETARAKVERVA
jgi:hypothetical protein